MQSDSLTARSRQSGTIRAEPIPIRWDPSLPVFAKEEFLRAVGDEYGWLGGIDEAGELRCFLPYTIIRKAGLRLVRFRMETIKCGADLAVPEETLFLNSAVQYFRKVGADVIIPASNNSLFRTYPDCAQAARYGSYVIDLLQPEAVLWRNVAKNSRQNIEAARKDGVSIREGVEFLDPAYDAICETYRRSGLGFMGREAFKRFAHGLGENCKLFMAEHHGEAQSYSLFAFSTHCAYWVYGGNIYGQHQGATKFLQWEAIRRFQELGVHKLDFYGARINPQKGSKQEGINRMKKHLGATLLEGYMWKCALRPLRSWVYSVGVRWMRGGDIVDQETARLRNPSLGADDEERS